MKIAFHGGKCCGVKTIHSFPSRTDAILDSIEKATFKGGEYTKMCKKDPDREGCDVSSESNFFTHHAEAPEETATERLDRYLAFLDKYRHAGVIEIILNEIPDKWSDFYDDEIQIKVWGPVIEERGFVLVTSAWNSNSDNKIHIFHKVTGQEEYVGEQ